MRVSAGGDARGWITWTALRAARQPPGIRCTCRLTHSSGHAGFLRTYAARRAAAGSACLRDETTPPEFRQLLHPVSLPDKATLGRIPSAQSSAVGKACLLPSA